MTLSIDFSDRRPIYQQLRDQVVEAIARGELRDGDALPTIRQLAADLAINPHTVHRAYTDLRDAGLIALGRRRGAAVRVPGRDGPDVERDLRGRLRPLLAEALAMRIPTDDILALVRTVLAELAAGRPAGKAVSS